MKNGSDDWLASTYNGIGEKHTAKGCGNLRHRNLFNLDSTWRSILVVPLLHLLIRAIQNNVPAVIRNPLPRRLISWSI
jgi:hypothetical protein